MHAADLTNYVLKAGTGTVVAAFASPSIATGPDDLGRVAGDEPVPRALFSAETEKSGSPLRWAWGHAPAERGGLGVR